MSRLQTLFECIGEAVHTCDGIPGVGPASVGRSLAAVARATHERAIGKLSVPELRNALREVVASSEATIELALRDAIYHIARDASEADRSRLVAFLTMLPALARQWLRRPDDPRGTSLPESFHFDAADDWLPLLPDRLHRFRVGDSPKGLDDWMLADLRGLGTFGETWRALPAVDADAEETEEVRTNGRASCLKFITAPEARANFHTYGPLLQEILDTPAIAGIVPLQAVYLASDPPCLQYAYVPGYDLTGLIHDWRWRLEHPRPQQAATIVRRIARIVGKLHRLPEPIVHGALKPANILLHPTSDGKVSVWLSDHGWGSIAARIERDHRDETRTARRLRRGAHAPVYQSPEQRRGEELTPRDDIYALGVIWHQLLARDATIGPPTTEEWTLGYRRHGLTENHSQILNACLSLDPQDRPADGQALFELLEAEPVHSGDDSRTFRLKVSLPEMDLPGTSRSGTGLLQKPPAKLPERFVNALGMTFVRIAPGQFRMGALPDEMGRQACEGPPHTVSILRPFYLGMVPVTQGQYQQLMGRNPAHFGRSLGGGSDHPVEQVTYEDALRFCEQLMQLPAEAEQLRTYRLPTEAEWEYACRAGTITAYAFGERLSGDQAVFMELHHAARSTKPLSRTEKVGTRQANPWGLHDMHGNVLEWCHDWFDAEAYPAGEAVDPLGPTQGWQRVVRGGSYRQLASDCRSAARFGRAPSSRENSVGFRVVLEVPAEGMGEAAR